MGPLCLAQHIRRVYQHFGWDAAPRQAGAAKLPLFNNGHLKPPFGRRLRHRQSGPRADHYQVKHPENSAFHPIMS